MKKVFVISAILLVGLVSIVVSALWITRGRGPTDAAALLPADTVVDGEPSRPSAHRRALAENDSRKNRR